MKIKHVSVVLVFVGLVLVSRSEAGFFDFLKPKNSQPPASPMKALPAPKETGDNRNAVGHCEATAAGGTITVAGEVVSGTPNSAPSSTSQLPALITHLTEGTETPDDLLHRLKTTAVAKIENEMKVRKDILLALLAGYEKLRPQTPHAYVVPAGTTREDQIKLALIRAEDEKKAADEIVNFPHADFPIKDRAAGHYNVSYKTLLEARHNNSSGTPVFEKPSKSTPMHEYIQLISSPKGLVYTCIDDTLSNWSALIASRFISLHLGTLFDPAILQVEGAQAKREAKKEQRLLRMKAALLLMDFSIPEYTAGGNKYTNSDEAKTGMIELGLRIALWQLSRAANAEEYKELLHALLSKLSLKEPLHRVAFGKIITHALVYDETNGSQHINDIVDGNFFSNEIAQERKETLTKAIMGLMIEFHINPTIDKISATGELGPNSLHTLLSAQFKYKLPEAAKGMAWLKDKLIKSPSLTSDPIFDLMEIKFPEFKTWCDDVIEGI